MELAGRSRTSGEDQHRMSNSGSVESPPFTSAFCSQPASDDGEAAP